MLVPFSFLFTFFFFFGAGAGGGGFSSVLRKFHVRDPLDDLILRNYMKSAVNNLSMENPRLILE